ncbi:MAG TPA: hypothetical protein VIY48_13585 [Candidatus Paceibacterota bacterium]
MSKYLGLLAGLTFGVAVVAPSFVGAQTSNALLSVYVQVANPSSSAYNYVAQHNASDFNVIVAGQSVSPSNFFGSQTGTQVSLGTGSYSVAVTGNQYGYTPTYSQGCNGTLGAGQTGLCIVTMSPQYNNYYPNVYPYPYTYMPSLTCTPANQTVGLNQNVSFTAQGGVGGTYNWRTPFNNYPNVGPVLTVSFNSSGSQLVTVTNGAQSATCEVTVNNTYYPTPASTSYYQNYPYTTYPNTTYPNTIYPYGYNYNTSGCTSCTNYTSVPCTSCGYTTPVITNTYYPRLPNTGVEPLTVVQLALALTLLSGVALLAMPYVRKTLSVVVK